MKEELRKHYSAFLKYFEVNYKPKVIRRALEVTDIVVRDKVKNKKININAHEELTSVKTRISEKQ